MRHRPATLLIVGLLILPLAGCAITPGQKARQHQKQVHEEARKQLNQTERQRLEKEFGQFDHVTDISVGYTDVWPEKGSVSVGMNLPIIYRNTQTQDHISDEVIRAVWLSRIEPLDELTVYFGWDNPEGPGANDSYHPLSGDTGRAELTQQYGPRPTGTDSPTS